MKLQAGAVIWITGLPSSGKSTLAEALLPRLRASGRSVLWLDSDDLRRVLTPAPTYSAAERDWFYGAIAAIAARAAQGGVTVLISATAPLRKYRDHARSSVDRFLEVYLACDRELLLARDPKGLYRRSAAGEIANLPGAGATYEPPIAPELSFDSGRMSCSEMAGAILARLDGAW